MSKLTKAQRDKLPSEDFGDEKNRLFPITSQEDVESAARLIGKAKNPKAVKARILEICHRKKLKPPAAWIEEASMAEVPFAVEPSTVNGTDNGGYVERDIKVLAKVGDYPFPEDKGGMFSLTPEDFLSAEAGFSPVPIRDTHGGGFGSSIFDGKLGHVTAVHAADEGANVLAGKARVPVWLDRLFQGQPIPCSANWCRQTKRIKDVALVTNPRISEAALFAAFAESEGKGRPMSPHGQKLMQFIHDHAAMSGAKCSEDHSPAMMSQLAGGTGNDEELLKRQREAGFTAPHESEALQKIHDLALGSGAACALWREGMRGKLKEYDPGHFYHAARNMMPAYRNYQPGRYAEMSADAGFSAAERDALLAQLAQEREARIEADAVAFAATHADRLTPAEYQDAIDDYRQAALDDASAGGSVFFSDDQGQRTQGTRVQRLLAQMARRPRHGRTQEQLAGSEALFALHQQQTGISPEREELERDQQEVVEYARQRNKTMGGKPMLQDGPHGFMNGFKE